MEMMVVERGFRQEDPGMDEMWGGDDGAMVALAGWTRYVHEQLMVRWAQKYETL